MTSSFSYRRNGHSNYFLLFGRVASNLFSGTHIVKLCRDLLVLLLVAFTRALLVVVQVMEPILAHRLQQIRIRAQLLGRLIAFLHVAAPGFQNLTTCAMNERIAFSI